MKIIENIAPIFQPVVIQIDTQEELNFFRQVCGSVPGFVLEEFGIKDWKNITNLWATLSGQTTQCPSLKCIQIVGEN